MHGITATAQGVRHGRHGTGHMFNTSDSYPTAPIAMTPVYVFLPQHDFTLDQLPVHNSAACSPAVIRLRAGLHLQPCCVYPLLIDHMTNPLLQP